MDIYYNDFARTLAFALSRILIGTLHFHRTDIRIQHIYRRVFYSDTFKKSGVFRGSFLAREIHTSKLAIAFALAVAPFPTCAPTVQTNFGITIRRPLRDYVSRDSVIYRRIRKSQLTGISTNRRDGVTECGR